MSAAGTLGGPDPRAARGATGLLAEFNRAGVLTTADVHVADRLAVLAGETDQRVALAAALAVRAVRQGSVCADLAVAHETVVVDPDGALAREPTLPAPEAAPLPWPEPSGWVAACAASPLVTAATADPDSEVAGPPRPLHLEGTLLYLDRYWQDERLVADELARRMAASPLPVDDRAAAAVLDGAFPGADAADQRAAAHLALSSPLTVVTGGPGTGKTHTVAGLLAALLAQPGAPRRVALAAPTGKAAARLSEAVHARATGPWAGAAAPALASAEARTLHRLLGSRPGSRTRFRHDRHDRLPYEVVVVDETSMVSLPLMARLMAALRPDARLVLVGDPDQLSSVEAGAVLRDIVDLGERRPDGGPVRRLRHNFRTGAADLHALAAAVRDGDPEAVMAVLTRGGDVELVDLDPGRWGSAGAAPLAGLRTDVVRVGREVAGLAAEGDGDGALRAASAHRLLCGRRSGPHGAVRWADEVERWLADAGIESHAPGWPRPRWPMGTPLLVTANDYDNGLANGDAGVVVARAGGGVTGAFAAPGGLRTLHPDRVAQVASAHALTVHKAQGSEYDAVTVILPPEGSPLLTRELLYTAVTRARSRVRVLGTAASVAHAVRTQVRRAGGLVPNAD
ncbi:MAG: exodeoxyribonuclease V subunit alpha [Kineosporiaceae bacterium]